VERAAARDPARLAISVGRTRGRTRHLLRFDLAASALLDAGVAAGSGPGWGDFRRDRETAALALHYLRARRGRFLFLGLGEPDEYAHRNDYRGYLHALVHADRVIGEVRAVLRELERNGHRTTLMVTTDHGRSADFVGHGSSAPESAHAWLVASGHGIARRGLVLGAGTQRLADVASTIRQLAGVGTQVPGSTPLLALLGSEKPQLLASSWSSASNAPATPR
jgi:hypothetical protein